MLAGSIPRMSPNVARVRTPPRRGVVAIAESVPPIGAGSSFEHAVPKRRSKLAARIERIAQALPEQVEADDGEQDREAGRARHPRRSREVVLALEEHVP